MALLDAATDHHAAGDDLAIMYSGKFGYPKYLAHAAVFDVICSGPAVNSIPSAVHNRTGNPVLSHLVRLDIAKSQDNIDPRPKRFRATSACPNLPGRLS